MRVDSNLAQTVHAFHEILSFLNQEAGVSSKNNYIIE